MSFDWLEITSAGIWLVQSKMSKINVLIKSKSILKWTNQNPDDVISSQSKNRETSWEWLLVMNIMTGCWQRRQFRFISSIHWISFKMIHADTWIENLNMSHRTPKRNGYIIFHVDSHQNVLHSDRHTWIWKHLTTNHESKLKLSENLFRKLFILFIKFWCD